MNIIKYDKYRSDHGKNPSVKDSYDMVRVTVDMSRNRWRHIKKLLLDPNWTFKAEEEE